MRRGEIGNPRCESGIGDRQNAADGGRRGVFLRRRLLLPLALALRPIGQDRRAIGKAQDKLAVFLGDEILARQDKTRSLPSAALTLPCSPSAASTSRKCTRMGLAASSGFKIGRAACRERVCQYV